MPKRSQPGEWWKGYFDAQYLLEYEPLFALERDRQEASRMIDLLGLPSGARILDVPCGQGRHAHLFAEEARRRHADDGDRSTADANNSIETAGISAESALPIPVTCDRDRMVAGCAVVIDGKGSTNRGVDS